MKIEIIRTDSGPVSADADVFASELPIIYLQGIRDAAGIDPVLIGSNGSEIQMNRNSVPFYTKYQSLDEALKGLESNEF